jgi:hypothetical protein
LIERAEVRQISHQNLCLRDTPACIEAWRQWDANKRQLIGSISTQTALQVVQLTTGVVTWVRDLKDTAGNFPLPKAKNSDAQQAIDCAAPLTTDSIAELLPSVPAGFNISQAIPESDIESFDFQELLSRIASEHGLIERIERKELELAFAKLNCARNAGLLLQEFKRRCNYGEFLSSLESAGIRPRTAQDYMVISKYWNLIETKARSSAFLKDCETLSINWALAAVRDEKKSLKKSLKSAAAPSNLDNSQTPRAPDQPILDLAIGSPPVETVQPAQGDLVQISSSNAVYGGNTGTVRGLANGGRSVIVRLDGGSVPSEIFNLSDAGWALEL